MRIYAKAHGWSSRTSKLQWDKFVKHHLQENEWSYAKIIGMVQERCGRNCASLGENKNELI